MRVTADAFRQLRFTGFVLFLAIITAAGAIYWGSVQRHQRYLSSRDFRLLGVLASQTQNVIEGFARMVERSAGSTSDMSTWLKSAGPSVPILKEVVLVSPSDVDGVSQQSSSVPRSSGSRLTIESDSSGSRLQLHTPKSKDDPALTLRVGVAALLGPTFSSKLRHDVFDTFALAAPDGRVALAIGRRQQELQSTSLDTLLTAKELAGGMTFEQLARTISVHDAVIAGVNYRLFIQPCCASVAAQANATPGKSPRAGMIIVGLIESDAVHGAALAISPDLVLVGIVLTLMALVLWPFLKLTFLGERQRVTLWDLVQLGTCSVFGLALGAIVIITADLYTRLNADIDEQLEAFATALEHKLGIEAQAAYRQLSALEASLMHCPLRRVWPMVPGADGYPDYDTFALIDPEGHQTVKSGPGAWVPGLIPVRRRVYFKAIQEERYWHDMSFCTPTPEGLAGGAGQSQAKNKSAGCFLESVWSRTTGQQQAVLSKPTGNATLPVAAIAIPMRSVIKPVLPPGFEYAVIDDTGMVLFHSDSQRNTLENLFIETDHDRRLRAMIAGHTSGPLSTTYWGRPYRAHVSSLNIPGWSIVTLFDKQRSRGLVLEWTAVSLLLLTLYLAVWVLVMLVALKMGVSWIWPDSWRRSRYLILARVYAALVAIFGALAFSGYSELLPWVGVVLAACAWIIGFLVLRKRPSAAVEAGRSRNAASEYALAGTLFLVLSGVVPGVAFVVWSYDMHIEPYVKDSQLGLARDLAGRAARTCDDHARTPSPELSELDRYCSFFYGTSVAKRVAEEGAETRKRRRAGHHDLFSMLEPYLPYYTESSVARRELLHKEADDATWTSTRAAGGRLEFRVPQDGGTSDLVVSSMLPAAVPFWSGTARRSAADHPARNPMFPQLAPALLMSLGLFAYGVVAFALRHVYLASVYEPLWASGRLVATAGDNLLVLCENSQSLAEQIQDVSKLNLGPIVRSDDEATMWTRALMKISRGEPGRAVVITDLDTELEDVALTHTKVELLQELVNDRARTVVVLVQNPPAMLQGSVRPGQHGQDRALWATLFNAFVTLDWRNAPDDRRGQIPVTVTPPKSGWRQWFTDNLHPASTFVGEVLEEEGTIDRFVRRLCEDIRDSQAYQSGSLTREQILDEIGERASNYYQRLWDNCSDDEKVVLGHVAQHGLTNAASRRVVRRLLVRHLLTKDPDLRLMNRTFRSFILASPRMREVAQLEGLAEPSTWDRVRMPFAFGAVAAGAFLFTTQRDTFNQTVTSLAAVATIVPTIRHVVSVIAQRDPAGVPPRSNA